MKSRTVVTRVFIYQTACLFLDWSNTVFMPFSQKRSSRAQRRQRSVEMLAAYPIEQAASGVFEKQESTFVTGVEPLQKRGMSNLSTQEYARGFGVFF